MILDEVKAEYVKELLKKGQRADDRGFYDYREVRVEKGIIPNAEGSALAHIGNTKVMAGVKIDLAEPYADRPDEGTIAVNAEFAPIAHPEFQPGPPNEDSIELARVVDRGIRSAECVDVKKLFLSEGKKLDQFVKADSMKAGDKVSISKNKVLAVYIDLYILDHCGNLTDTAALAAMAALTDCKMPKYDESTGKLVRADENGKRVGAPLPLNRKAFTCSFEKIEGKCVLDANNQEEEASKGRLTIGACSPELICSGQKSGAAGFTQEEMLELAEVTLQKWKMFDKLV